MSLLASARAAAPIMLLAAGAGLALLSAQPAASANACRPRITPIPMKPLASGHHSVTVMLNGRAATFLVDTGAGATIIHSPALSRFALRPVAGAGTATNASGRLRFDPVSVTGFAVGGTRTRLDKIYAMDISYLVDAVSASSPQPIEGLVGQDVLRAQKAVVDLDKSILYLADPDATCADTPQVPVVSATGREPRRSAL